MPVNDGYGPDDEEPPATPNPRYGEATYGSVTRNGPLERVDAVGDAPWRINATRVNIASKVPTPTRGESHTIVCVVFDGDGVRSAEGRYRTLRRYLRDAPWTKTMPGQGKCYYRENHDAPDGAQLVELAPLAANATGSEDTPARRPTVDEARWAVVTGGADQFKPAEYPSPVYEIELELTTIAPASEFADEADPRQAVRDAYEHNGLGL